jgi:hypothetical protein
MPLLSNVFDCFILYANFIALLCNGKTLTSFSKLNLRSRFIKKRTVIHKSAPIVDEEIRAVKEGEEV